MKWQLCFQPYRRCPVPEDLQGHDLVLPGSPATKPQATGVQWRCRHGLQLPWGKVVRGVSKSAGDLAMSTSISILIHAKPRVMLTTNKQTLHGGRLNLQVQGDHDHEFCKQNVLGFGIISGGEPVPAVVLWGPDCWLCAAVWEDHLHDGEGKLSESVLWDLPKTPLGTYSEVRVI